MTSNPEKRLHLIDMDQYDVAIVGGKGIMNISKMISENKFEDPKVVISCLTISGINGHQVVVRLKDGEDRKYVQLDRKSLKDCSLVCYFSSQSDCNN